MMRKTVRAFVLAALLSALAGQSQSAAEEGLAPTDGQIMSLLSRIAFVTRDFDQSLMFYRDALGFEETFSGDISRPIVLTQMNLPATAKVYFSVLQKPDGAIGSSTAQGAMIGLLKVTNVELPALIRPDDAPLVIGEPMLAVRTTDIVAVEAKLRQMGVRFLVDPMDSPDGTQTELVVHDPNGIRVHVVERREDDTD